MLRCSCYDLSARLIQSVSFSVTGKYQIGLQNTGISMIKVTINYAQRNKIFRKQNFALTIGIRNNF